MFELCPPVKSKLPAQEPRRGYRSIPANQNVHHLKNPPPGLIRCLELDESTNPSGWHFHEEYEIVFSGEKSGYFYVGDHVGLFEPGHLVLIAPRLPHCWVSTQPSKMGLKTYSGSIRFAEEPFIKATEVIPELADVKNLLQKAQYGVEFYDVDDAIKKKLRAIKTSSGVFRLTEFLRLISYLIKDKNYSLLSQKQVQTQGEALPSFKQLEDVIEKVRKNFEEELNMEKLANSINMNSSCFSRHFKKATGYTFTDFVNQLRVTKACSLLLETDQYVSTICYSVGFNNIANFNRRFKDLKGSSPREFRRIVQGGR